MGDSPVVIDLTTCKACGICVGVCPQGVFDTDDRDQPVAARPEDCTACLLCEWHCPDFAISVRRRAPAKKTPAAAGAPGADDEPDTAHVATVMAAAHDAHHTGDARGDGRGCGED